MKKIAKVIDQCNDCEFFGFAKFDLSQDSPMPTHVDMCLKPNPPTILRSLKTGETYDSKIEIPENCPLEDYQQKDTSNED